MSTCRCCGQHIEAAARTSATSSVVRVEDTVLAACNTAFDAARTCGHAHVEIAHAVVAVAMSESGAVALARHGISAQQAGHAADLWLAEWAQKRNEGEALSTSLELKQVLRAAEEMAQRAGRTHGSLDDLLAALTAQSDTLWSAAFWSTSTSQQSPAEPGRAERHRLDVRTVTKEGRPEASARTTLVQPSLLDREYAWLRDIARSQTPNAASSSRVAQGAAASGVTRAHSPEPVPATNTPVPLAATSRPSGVETPSGGSARVARLFAAATGASKTAVSAAVTQKPASPSAREDGLTQSILLRLDTQERTLAQRLDMQQRMIAELAETFARTMRDLARARSTGATAHAGGTSQQARGQDTEAARGSAIDAERDSALSTRSGARQPRNGRGRWRRQSWSTWRTRQRSRGATQRDGAADGYDREGWLRSDQQRLPREGNDGHSGAGSRIINGHADAPNAQSFLPHVSEGGHEEGHEREKRFYLALDDDIEKAPSIGPRTAGQLNGVGLMTVRDLLTCDTAAVAARLQSRYITAERLVQWQAQSRLVCTIPWLRGTHAQLLAGAGFDTIDKIVAAEAGSVCAAILKFAATRDGMSVLRSSPPPGEDWVIKRLEHARAAEPGRAAA